MKLKFIALLIAISQIFAIANDTTSEKSIVVYGDSRIKVEPDMAIVDFIISSRANTPQDAKEKNSKLSSKVKKIINKDDIQKQNIKIKNNAITPQDIYNKDGKIETTFYLASQNIEIILTDISKESEFLNELTKIGIEDISTKYKKSKMQEQVDLAIKEAINSAVLKAKNMAQSTNATLGDILEIEEIQTSPSYGSYRMTAFGGAEQDLNGSDGVIDISAKIRIKFAIK